MPAGWLRPVLILLALLLGGALEVAWGQGLPVPGLERLSPEERQVVERNRERWERLAPEERQRVPENCRPWESLTAGGRPGARGGFQRFRGPPPREKPGHPPGLQR